MRARYIVIGVVLGVLLSSAVVVLAGNLDPPSGPAGAASQMVTLEQIYNRLYDGTEATKMTSFTEPASGPMTPTMHTLDDIYGLIGTRAPVAKTGQTGCWDVNGSPIGCAGSGQDGEYESGFAWPDPRFTDNGDGTVTDNLTGLIWLQNGNCYGPQTWTGALSKATGGNPWLCANPQGFTAKDWRLPNIRELQSLIDYSQFNWALPSGPPFSNVKAASYWTSTTYRGDTNHAWLVDMETGLISKVPKGSPLYYVWPVKGGH